MRIFQINTVYNSGSTGRIAADIKHALEQAGHECFVAYGRGENSEKNTECVSNKIDLYSHVLLTRLTDKTGFYSKKSTQKLIERIKTFEPDIIHLHNIHGYYLNIEMLFEFLKEYDKPVVWTLHDCWSFTGHCAYFDFSGCEKWKSGCHHCPSLAQYPKSFVDSSKCNYERKKKLFTSISNMTIVTPSKWLGKIVGNSFLGTYPVRVINNGIDTNVFKPTEGNIREKYNITAKKVILGVASVWEPRKGFDDFIKLAELIDQETQIVLVGLNDQQMKMLPSNVIGISRTENRQELTELYSMADVLFNPTYEDNYPTVNLEALACGTKVLTYATGGSPESAFLSEEKCIKKGNYEAVTNMMETEQYPNIDVSCISLQHMKEEYLKLYKELQEKSL